MATAWQCPVLMRLLHFIPLSQSCISPLGGCTTLCTVQTARNCWLITLKGKEWEQVCPFGCNAIGNAHHLFVHCMEYTEWRNQARVELLADTKKKLCGLLKDEELELVKVNLLPLAESIFSDNSPMWLLQKNVYYLGKHPSLTSYIDKTIIRSEILRRHVTSHILMDWHLRCIQLAGRIFGDYQRRMAVMNGCRKRAT